MEDQKLVNLHEHFVIRTWNKYLAEREDRKIALKKMKQDHSWYRKFDKKKRYQK